MTEPMSFADMIKSAQEAGGSTEAPPAGTYQGVVTTAAAKRSKNGKVEVGMLIRVTEGPSQGLAAWSNQYLSPENPTALGIWFRTFEALGIPTSWWAQFVDMDQAAAQAATHVKGKTCTFVVEYEDWKGEMRPRVKAIKKPASGSGTVPAQAAPLGTPAGAGQPAVPVALPAATAPFAPAAMVPSAPSAIPAPPASPF